MSDSLDDWLDGLQKEIDQDVKDTYSEAVFERWKNPTHMGRLDDPDASASLKGTCGDTMEIYLKIEKDRIIKAGAFTDGCGSSMVCGSVTAEMAEGKTVAEAMSIRPEDVIDVLGGLPEEERHCAFLAAGTLNEALDRYMRDAASKDE